MRESIYDFVMGQLQASKGSWPAVAERTGMSIRTIGKIARREIKNPRIDKIQILADHFREHPAQ